MRCGVVWCGVVWCGVVWCGVVWCGVVWCCVVWCGVWCVVCMVRAVVCGVYCVLCCAVVPGEMDMAEWGGKKGGCGEGTGPSRRCTEKEGGPGGEHGSREVHAW